MTVQSFTFNPFQTNSFVCHDAGEAVIVDASCDTPEAVAQMQAYVEEHDLTVRHLLLTHGHIDHIFGCQALQEAFGLEWTMHRADLGFLQKAPEQATLFGLRMEQPPLPTTFLEAGDVVTFGNTTWEVRYTPGHSPGSITFYDAEAQVVLAGDVLFYGSIGRTDLHQGDLPTLMRSIYQELLTLDDEVTVYCGHGPATTIGRERRENPFIREYRDLVP